MASNDDLQHKIVKQLEYYFSDVNLMKDKFLRAETGEDGWVPMDTLLKFQRLTSISDDASIIIDAVNKSQSDLIEASTEKGIRRKTEFAYDENDSLDDKFAYRTLYISGFNSDATLDDIEAWVKSCGYKWASIHMRRQPNDRKFKGNIFVTFESKEDAEKFLVDDKGHKFNSNITIRKWQSDFRKEILEERQERINEKAKKAELTKHAQMKVVEARMVKGALLELKNVPSDPTTKKPAVVGDKRKADGEKAEEKEKEEDDKVDDNAEEDEKEDPSSDNGGDDAENSGEKKELRSIIAFKAWLSEKLGDLSAGMWVDMYSSEGRAVVRMKGVDSAEKAVEKLADASEYNGAKLECRVITGEEEKEYWLKYVTAMDNRRKSGHHHHRHRGGGGGGGGGWKKPRRY